jgi:hypothetical protein
MNETQRTRLIDYILRTDPTPPEPLHFGDRSELEGASTSALIYGAISVAGDSGLSSDKITEPLVNDFGVTLKEFRKYKWENSVCDIKDSGN